MGCAASSPADRDARATPATSGAATPGTTPAVRTSKPLLPHLHRDDGVDVDVDGNGDEEAATCGCLTKGMSRSAQRCNDMVTSSFVGSTPWQGGGGVGATFASAADPHVLSAAPDELGADVAHVADADADADADGEEEEAAERVESRLEALRRSGLLFGAHDDDLAALARAETTPDGSLSTLSTSSPFASGLTLTASGLVLAPIPQLQLQQPVLSIARGNTATTTGTTAATFDLDDDTSAASSPRASNAPTPLPPPSSTLAGTTAPRPSPPPVVGVPVATPFLLMGGVRVAAVVGGSTATLTYREGAFASSGEWPLSESLPSTSTSSSSSAATTTTTTTKPPPALRVTPTDERAHRFSWNALTRFAEVSPRFRAFLESTMLPRARTRVGMGGVVTHMLQGTNSPSDLVLARALFDWVVLQPGERLDTSAYLYLLVDESTRVEVRMRRPQPPTTGAPAVTTVALDDSPLTFELGRLDWVGERTFCNPGVAIPSSSSAHSRKSFRGSLEAPSNTAAAFAVALAASLVGGSGSMGGGGPSGTPPTPASTSSAIAMPALDARFVVRTGGVALALPKRAWSTLIASAALSDAAVEAIVNEARARTPERVRADVPSLAGLWDESIEALLEACTTIPLPPNVDVPLVDDGSSVFVLVGGSDASVVGVVHRNGLVTGAPWEDHLAGLSTTPGGTTNLDRVVIKSGSLIGVRSVLAMLPWLPGAVERRLTSSASLYNSNIFASASVGAGAGAAPGAGLTSPPLGPLNVDAVTAAGSAGATSTSRASSSAAASSSSPLSGPTLLGLGASGGGSVSSGGSPGTTSSSAAMPPLSLQASTSVLLVRAVPRGSGEVHSSPSASSAATSANSNTAAAAVWRFPASLVAALLSHQIDVGAEVELRTLGNHARFDAVLHHPLGRKHLLAFLKTHHADESLQFWLDVKTFKRRCVAEDAAAAAMATATATALAVERPATPLSPGTAGTVGSSSTGGGGVGGVGAAVGTLPAPPAMASPLSSPTSAGKDRPRDNWVAPSATTGASASTRPSTGPPPPIDAAPFDRNAEARRIADVYIRQGAPRQVNIRSETRVMVQTALDGPGPSRPSSVAATPRGARMGASEEAGTGFDSGDGGGSESAATGEATATTTNPASAALETGGLVATPALSPIPDTLFDQATREIEKLMNDDSYSRFRRSDGFERMMAEIVRSRPSAGGASALGGPRRSSQMTGDQSELAEAGGVAVGSETPTSSSARRSLLYSPRFMSSRKSFSLNAAGTGAAAGADAPTVPEEDDSVSATGGDGSSSRHSSPAPRRRGQGAAPEPLNLEGRDGAGGGGFGARPRRPSKSDVAALVFRKFSGASATATATASAAAAGMETASQDGGLSTSLPTSPTLLASSSADAVPGQGRLFRGMEQQAGSGSTAPASPAFGATKLAGVMASPLFKRRRSLSEFGEPLPPPTTSSASSASASASLPTSASAAGPAASLSLTRSGSSKLSQSQPTSSSQAQAQAQSQSQSQAGGAADPFADGRV